MIACTAQPAMLIKTRPSSPTQKRKGARFCRKVNAPPPAPPSTEFTIGPILVKQFPTLCQPVCFVFYADTHTPSTTAADEKQDRVNYRRHNSSSRATVNSHTQDRARAWTRVDQQARPRSAETVPTTRMAGSLPLSPPP